MADALITDMGGASPVAPTGPMELPVNIPGSPDTDGHITVDGLKVYIGSKHIASLFPRDNAPPAANFATIDTRNSKPCLNFDQTTEEIAVFPFIIPDGIDLTSGIKVRIRSTMSTATSGNVGWKAAFMRGNTDINSDSFDSDTSDSTSVSGTSGIPVTTEITCTAIDGMLAGELGYLRITRNTSVGSNATGDAELLSVDLRGAA